MNIEEATQAVVEFGRVIGQMAAEAKAELAARGIARRPDPLYDGPMPALDQLAELEGEEPTHD